MKFLTYVKSGFPLLWIKSHEEQRVLHDCVERLNEVRTVDAEGREDFYRVFGWDVADGIRPLLLEDGEYKTGDTIEGTATDPLLPLNWLDEQAEDNTVLFLQDYHAFLKPEFQDSVLLTRKIRNLALKFKAQGKVLCIVSPGLHVPLELEKDMTVIDYKLPGREELQGVLRELCQALETPYPADDHAVVEASLGMTATEAENAYAAAYQENHHFKVEAILQEKAAIVKKSGMLEVVEASETLDDIGGLENLKEWLSARSECFSEEARAYGIEPPKGALLVGVPGSGKSLAIKAISNIWKRPCLRLDMGRVYGSYVGESEHNIHHVLGIAEAAAPVVLWLDEMEKSLSGNRAGMESHETTRRVFQILLTWMQERKSDVFIAATANSVQSLPPELLRSGRIDAKFWVDLPDAVQRAEILRIHMRKRNKALTPEIMENMVQLVQACENFTGAEIEAWVKETLVHAFHVKHAEVQVDDFMETVEDIVPISRLSADDIAASRQWAQERGIKNASITHTAPQQTSTRRRVVA